MVAWRWICGTFRSTQRSTFMLRALRHLSIILQRKCHFGSKVKPKIALAFIDALLFAKMSPLGVNLDFDNITAIFNMKHIGVRFNRQRICMAA